MRSPDPTLLAIDLGTSGPKVALFGADGALLGAEVEPVPLLLQPGGGAEQAPADWWRAVCAAARRLTARLPDAAARVAGVGCTAQWSGTVPVDAQGAPLCNAILWMDTRGAGAVRAMTGRGFPRVLGYSAARLLAWVRLTGGAPGHSGKDSLAHVLWLREARPDVWARTHKLLEPKDYLNLRLTGRFAATHDSIALHWVTDNRDPSAVTYSPRLLALAGLPREKLPDLVRSVDVLGALLPGPARELGLPERGVVVVGGAPDVQAAAVGSGAVEDYAPHLYVGTSAWISCHVPFKKTDPVRNMASLVSAVPGRYFVANSQECAGVCLSFLRDNLFFPQDALHAGPPPEGTYAAFDAMAAAAPPGAGKVLFTPWLYGERTPVEDPTVRGGFHNVSLHTTRAHLVRAVFEGVAFNARWLAGAVEHFTGRPLGPLRAIGGGARSAVWCQVFADVLGRPVLQVEDPVQATARGAAAIAAVGLGLARFEDVPARVPVARTFAPDPAHRGLYDALFAEFVRLYHAHRRIHARLNAAA